MSFARSRCTLRVPYCDCAAASASKNKIKIKPHSSFLFALPVFVFGILQGLWAVWTIEHEHEARASTWPCLLMDIGSVLWCVCVFVCVIVLVVTCTCTYTAVSCMLSCCMYMAQRATCRMLNVHVHVHVHKAQMAHATCGMFICKCKSNSNCEDGALQKKWHAHAPKVHSQLDSENSSWRCLLFTCCSFDTWECNF